MRKQVCLMGAVAALVAAAVGQGEIKQVRPESGAWQPIRGGLTEAADRILPATVSPAHPVRIVATALDRQGRPVTTARTATDRRAATRIVEDGQRARNAVTVELDAPVRAIDTGQDAPVRAINTTQDAPVRAIDTGQDAPVRAIDATQDALVRAIDTSQDSPVRALDTGQWDLDRIGAPAAWPRSTGSGVTVAVVDTGVDASHPDLAGQVLPGGDFITGSEGTSVDPNGHGTHVAGTIAAHGGISGIAPGARILPVRVLNADGGGYMSDAANGIVYAADHGADVINMSLGATTQVDAVTNAISYARSKGVVVVAAAGNARTSGSPVSYPAADPGVIAVAATDAADQPAYFSNRGGYVDVAAPGDGILSTYPRGGRRTMSGTSMASPHVAAVAALLKAADRSLTPDQVEQALESSAVDLGAPGRDDDYGYGRIDAAAALAMIPRPAQPSPATPAPAETTLPPTQTTPTPAETTPTPADTMPNPTDTTPPPAGTIPNPAETTPTPGGNGPNPAETAPAPGGNGPNPVETTPPPGGNNPSPAETTPTPAEGTPGPAGPTPTPNEGTPVPSRSTPAPAETTPNPAGPMPPPAPAETPAHRPTEPAPGPARLTAVAMLVRTGTHQLTAALSGVDGQTMQLQSPQGGGWVTVLTYPATRAVRVDGLPPGFYRLVAPETARYTSATSGVVRL